MRERESEPGPLPQSTSVIMLALTGEGVALDPPTSSSIGIYNLLYYY